MEDRNKIAGFVSYHNIIRPVGYALLAWPFFSALAFFCYLVFFFLSPNIYPTERVVCITGMVLSVCGFIFGLIIRKKYLKLFETEPGKSLYLAELLKYICFVVVSFSFIFYCLFFVENARDTFITGGVILLVMVGSVFATNIVVKMRIKKDKYNGRKNIDSRIIAFSVSGGCLVILMVIKNIVIRAAAENGSFIVFLWIFIATEASMILATIYYLKLKYAKKYGLEDYLPKRPNPSPYTGWK